MPEVSVVIYSKHKSKYINAHDTAVNTLTALANTIKLLNSSTKAVTVNKQNSYRLYALHLPTGTANIKLLIVDNTHPRNASDLKCCT
jgi:hypothetical protein